MKATLVLIWDLPDDADGDTMFNWQHALAGIAEKASLLVPKPAKAWVAVKEPAEAIIKVVDA